VSAFGRQWKRGILVMVTGYFDESGDPRDAPGFAVGGYVAETTRWLRFNRQWEEVLDLFEVPYFHMREFAHSVGPYKSWKGDEGKRTAFVSRLIKATKANVSFGACCNLLMADYKTVDAEYALSAVAPPYVLCALRCVDVVSTWAASRGHKKSEIRFVFEDSPHPKGPLYDWMKKMGFPAPIFESKQSHRAFEVADFLAWEHTKVIRKFIVGDFSDFRKSLQELLKIPHKSGIYIEPQLREMCVANAIKRRIPVSGPSNL
jgi:hypothetical protein